MPPRVYLPSRSQHFLTSRSLTQYPRRPLAQRSVSQSTRGWRRLPRLGVASIWLAVAATSLGSAAEPQFNRDIRPILADKCFACHGPDASQREAELRLDQAENATADRGGYRVIDRGHADRSELIARIQSTDEDLVMPPLESGKPLTPQEMKTLQDWINSGAEWQDHWSLIPPRRPTVPATASGTAPIDAFIRSQLRAAKSRPAPRAAPRVLARRLALDLTGLPPEAGDIAAFLADPNDPQYEALVDRLLASPHYGERLAVYWLDLVRYADTLGFHGDQNRSVSPYRDYVIEAFNDNLPFDQFTLENLAGDLLANGKGQENNDLRVLRYKVASTYNRLNRASAEGGVQPKEYLAKYAADRVRTTGSVWLGVTLGCAECHDHKFDPLSTKDFYSFAAFFADIRELGIVPGANHLAQLRVPTPEQNRELNQLAKQIDQLENQLQAQTDEQFQQLLQWRDAVLSSQNWSTVQARRLASESGTQLQQNDQGIITADGKADGDVYIVEAPFRDSRLTALRLDALTAPELPQQGPGRAGNGNFVVERVRAYLNGKPLNWTRSTSTHSQNGYGAAQLAQQQGTGWAILPQTGRSHSLVLQARAVELPPSPQPSTLRVEIVQRHGGQHTLGRWQLFSSDMASPPQATELISPQTLSVLRGTPEDWNEQQRAAAWTAFQQQAPQLSALRQDLAETRRQQQALQKSVVTTLAVESIPPREMRILPRGNWMDNSGAVVQPAVPEYFGAIAANGKKLTRLDLARWLTSGDQPLVARAFVNRLWMLFFGHGLCRSVDDLGAQGEWPTHPELLDWLAVEFVESGWDIKHMVKLVVMSETYRQTSQVGNDVRKQDPYNRLFARQSTWRLDAEMVRDQALALSGLLQRQVGGPSVRPYQPAGYWAQLNFPKRTYQADGGQKQYRRGVYTHWQRTFLHPSLLAFDAPAREECTAQRARSNTPLQALVLLNDPTYVEAARVLATRACTEVPDDSRQRVQWLYELVLSRPASAKEVQVLQGLSERELQRYAASPEDAVRLLQSGQAPREESIPAEELAVWTSVCRVLLNLHETITRY